MIDAEELCEAAGPDWIDEPTFLCELPKGHDGPHRVTLEWEAPR